MESTAVKNDLLVAAYVAIAVYFCMAFVDRLEIKYLALFSAGVGLALGTKATTIIALPSLFIVVIYCLIAAMARHSHANAGRITRNLVTLVVFSCLSVCLFVLPSGYWQNMRIFGHPFGPPEVREHLLPSQGGGQNVIEGTKNLLRYGMDFVSLDGMPAVGPILDLQRMIRLLPLKAIRGLGIDLDSGIQFGYFYDRYPAANEEVSYWGILGFGLIWPAVLVLSLGVVRSSYGRVLGLAAIVFLLSQSFVVHYQAWQGRYFITAAVFAVPAVGCFITGTTSRLFKYYVTIIVVLGCISAMGSVFFRHNAWLFSFNYKDKAYVSIFSLDRIGQMTQGSAGLYAALKKFDDIVPKNAVVCVCMPDLCFEYPLFGEKQTRSIIPGNFLARESVSPPQTAQFLLFSTACYTPGDYDIHLGLNWYLRDLDTLSQFNK